MALNFWTFLGIAECRVLAAFLAWANRILEDSSSFCLAFRDLVALQASDCMDAPYFLHSPGLSLTNGGKEKNRDGSRPSLSRMIISW